MPSPRPSPTGRGRENAYLNNAFNLFNTNIAL